MKLTSHFKDCSCHCRGTVSSWNIPRVPVHFNVPLNVIPQVRRICFRRQRPLPVSIVVSSLLSSNAELVIQFVHGERLPTIRNCLFQELGHRSGVIFTGWHLNRLNRRFLREWMQCVG
jgi:hypothetical protein